MSFDSVGPTLNASNRRWMARMGQRKKTKRERGFFIFNRNGWRIDDLLTREPRERRTSLVTNLSFRAAVLPEASSP